jgi:hypothetical protein
MYRHIVAVILCTALAFGFGVRDAHAQNILSHTVMVYHYQTGPDGKTKLIDQFEWLDLARWYRLVSFVPLQPIMTPGLAPKTSPADSYLITEIDGNGEPVREFAVTGTRLTVTGYQLIYRYFHDVRELGPYLTAQMSNTSRKPDSMEQPPLLRVQMTAEPGTTPPSPLTITDPLEVKKIAGFLEKLPPVSPIDIISRPADFTLPGTLQINKITNDDPAIPLEFHVGSNQVRVLERSMKTMTHLDRMNVLGEIRAARQFIELLKSTGQPVRKQY